MSVDLKTVDWQSLFPASIAVHLRNAAWSQCSLCPWCVCAYAVPRNDARGNPFSIMQVGLTLQIGVWLCKPVERTLFVHPPDRLPLLDRQSPVKDLQVLTLPHTRNSTEYGRNNALDSESDGSTRVARHPVPSGQYVEIRCAAKWTACRTWCSGDAAFGMTHSPCSSAHRREIRVGLRPVRSRNQSNLIAFCLSAV
jgi:hypothetical protein